MLDWKAYVKAGNALFTVENTETGERYTFKVRKHRERSLWIVKFLFNPTRYRYLGAIDSKGNFVATAQTQVTRDAATFRWFTEINKCINGERELPDKIKIWHANSCGRCGRTLTVPASIEAGFGPECILHVFAASYISSHISLESAKKIKKVIELQHRVIKAGASTVMPGQLKLPY